MCEEGEYGERILIMKNSGQMISNEAVRRTTKI
jgi:hypothetical protein